MTSRQTHLKHQFLTLRITKLIEENEKLQDCFYETKDWRKCQDEVKLYCLLFIYICILYVT